MPRKAASKSKAPAKKPVDKPVKKATPARKVACPDCERPRRDGDTKRSSGLIDPHTICPSCEGTGQVSASKSKK